MTRPVDGDRPDISGSGGKRDDGTVLVTAMELLLQVRQDPDDEDLRRRIESWVASDPVHAGAWNRVRRTWDVMGDLASHRIVPDRSLASPGAPSVVPRTVRSRRIARIACVTALLAASLAIFILPAIAFRPPADFMSGTAEVRPVPLDDGSVAVLAPQSALDVRFSGNGRAVSLRRGEAYFEVARDPSRPFSVAAGDMTVTALGTAFDVAVGERTVVVGVRSGVVAVDRDGVALDRLAAGERMILDRRDGRGVKDRVPLSEIAGWRDGTLFFADATIAEVVQALAAYQSGWTLIADDSLARERVTGLYETGDPDRALRALVRPFGGQMHSISPFLRVLTRP